MEETESFLDVIGAFRLAVEPLGFKLESIWINEPDTQPPEADGFRGTDDIILRISVTRKATYI